MRALRPKTVLAGQSSSELRIAQHHPFRRLAKFRVFYTRHFVQFSCVLSSSLFLLFPEPFAAQLFRPEPFYDRTRRRLATCACTLSFCFTGASVTFRGTGVCTVHMFLPQGFPPLVPMWCGWCAWCAHDPTTLFESTTLLRGHFHSKASWLASMPRNCSPVPRLGLRILQKVDQQT